MTERTLKDRKEVGKETEAKQKMRITETTFRVARDR